MKKYYYPLLAAATMLLATTSCSQDEELVRPSGEMTTFKVELNGVANSRTAGDGQTVNKLYYAVYDKAGTKVIYPNGKSFEKADISEGKASVDIPLMKSEAYDIVFWAQNEESGAYTVTDLKTISVNYPTDGTLKSNKENRDAFFNSLNDFTANGETQTVYLKRPFAQLNVATTITDWNEAVRQYQANGGTDAPVKYSAVTISQLATDFNAKSGVAGGETSAEIIFNKAELLDESIWIKGKDDEGNETKSEYKLLAMNYLLMTSDKGPQDINEHEAATGDNSKATVDVDFTLWKDDANEIMTANVPFVPIQRNYRTNIIGEFLTGDKTQFNIVVDADFDGDHNVKPEITFDDEKKTARIYNVAGLKYFRDLVNGTKSRATENKPDSYAGWTIFLEANMDLINEEWEPIAAESAFKGTFDGKNHTISNFTINRPEKSGVGFIGHLHGTVKNVKIANATVIGMKSVGALVGTAISSTLEGNTVEGNSSVTAVVNATTKEDGNNAGGLIGYISDENKSAIIRNTVSGVKVTAYADLGALAGTVNGVKSNLMVTGNKVSYSTVTADRTAEGEDRGINANQIVGRVVNKPTLEDNKAEEVTVVVNVNTQKGLTEALLMNLKNITVALTGNATYDVAAWQNNAMGGESTKTITIDGSSEARSAENYTLTFNHTGSDWNNIATNNGAKLILKNLKVTNSGHNDGPWNRHDLNFACDVEMENVYSDKAIALKAGGVLKNVTINDANTSDTYAIWIQPNGQTITVENCTIDMIECSDGRGIKIDEQYVDSPKKVTLNVSGTTFKTEEKSAVLVKSVAGADITWGEGNDISAVAADNFFAVWVDEDCAQYADLVTVNGVSKIVEGTETVGAEEPEKLAEAVNQENASILLKPGTYTFPSKVAKGVTIECTEGTVFEGTSSLNINGATVIGAKFSGTASGNSGTVAGTINGSFKDCTFEGVNALRYCYAGETVVFENCVFSGDVYGVHFDGGTNEAIFKNCTFSGFNAFGAAITLLTLEDCTFKANGKSSYNGANLWGNTNLVRTNFVFDGTASTEWIGLNAAKSGKTISLTGCKVNDGNGSVFDYFANFNGGDKVTVDNVEYALASTTEELTAAIEKVKEGDIISLVKGEYNGLFNLTGKKLTLVSLDKQATIKGMLWADNCDVTVKGLTLTNPDGVQHPNPTNSQYFTTINNQYPLVGAYNNADIKFEDCTFDIVGPTVYGFYGYAHNSPMFEGCTFNCNKIRPIASNGPALTINGCTFNDPYHYAARIFENSGETQTVVFTNNTIQGSNDKGEFEGINISKKGNTATVLGNFTIKGNTDVKYRHHKNVTMSANCTYDTDIANFAFEKEN